MLKGPNTAITLSIMLHLVLLAALVYSSTHNTNRIKQAKQKVTTIKSFLYKKPKKNIMNPLPRLNKPAHKAVTADSANRNASSALTESKTPANDVQKATGKLAIKAISKTVQTQPIKLPATTLKPIVKSGFSSYDRLTRLRNKVQKQQREQAFSEAIQQRSVSIMDAKPLPIPHTIVPLTREQQYQKNTSTSHVSSITKHDNGACTIHREQILGSPVEATTSSFACGESKFDRHFREHMQKVKNTLKTPSTNN